MNIQNLPEREYRSVGRFSATDVRELAPGPVDAVALGCPPALFAEVLEKRRAFRAGRPVVTKTPAPKVITDEMRRQKAADVAAQIYADEVAEFMKPQIFG